MIINDFNINCKKLYDENDCDNKEYYHIFSNKEKEDENTVLFMS